MFLFGKYYLITVKFLVSCQIANAEIRALEKMAKRRRVVPAEQLVVTVPSNVYVEIKINHALTK